MEESLRRRPYRDAQGDLAIEGMTEGDVPVGLFAAGRYIIAIGGKRGIHGDVAGCGASVFRAIGAARASNVVNNERAADRVVELMVTDRQEQFAHTTNTLFISRSIPC